MREYLTEAVVLDRENTGDLDGRIHLFTRKFGKLTAKAKSLRKVTSKLSPHLQPGNLVRARLVERRGLQLVDALKADKLGVSLDDLSNLSRLLAEGEPDSRLWTMLMKDTFNWTNTLAYLGWDPQEASCERCGQVKTTAFHLRTQVFFCKDCVLRLPRREVLYIA